MLGPASVQTALDALVSGADTRSSAAMFLFDAHGMLKSASTTTSNVGTGLSSGLSTDLHSAPVPGVEPSWSRAFSHPPCRALMRFRKTKSGRPRKTASNRHQNKASNRLRASSGGPKPLHQH
ncbi:hypothetical protein PQR02_39310 [Paraburkholderia sediminicola]|uniref:Uncharacterized protein n=1 Tax=Paraburkholderia rhynchosiae TaxID=487049 RepID=A0ACC7NPA7_9BURK